MLLRGVKMADSADFTPYGDSGRFQTMQVRNLKLLTTHAAEGPRWWLKQMGKKYKLHPPGYRLYAVIDCSAS